MTTLKILLVEDEESLARTLAQALRLGSHGRFEIDTVESAEQVFPLFEHTIYDVVISDLCLPGDDGLSVITKLKQISPKTQTILITGFGSDEIKEQADEISEGYLTKPFDMLDLLLLVQEIIDQPSGSDEPDFDNNPLAEGNNRRILVMEDDIGLRQIYTKALRKFNYQVDEAPTVQAARKLLSNRRYDIFICDLHMGRERGTELLKELREKFDESGTQIVMCSAYEQYRELTKEIGADYFLESPISLDTLLALVSRLMGTSHSAVAA